MIDELKNETSTSMESSVESLVKELKKVRTGRAQVSLLDAVMVNYYGSLTPLNQVANVTCPDARTFLITPWEASVLKDLDAAIVKASLGLSPINDGKVIRLKIPELTEDRRKELAKSVKKIAEDARISIRMVRKNSNEQVKVSLKDKAISEDDGKKYNDEIQKVTDSFIKRVDEIASKKETELLSV